MRQWSTACPDWEKRIIAGKSLIPFKPLYPDEAEAALAVFKSLFMVDAAPVIDEETGNSRPPTFGEACDQFVFDFVSAVFGCYDHKIARRTIREFFFLISKKNGKSTIAAGIMMTALVRNWRKSAELMIIAPTLEVANNAYTPAADMVRANKEYGDGELFSLMHVQDNFKKITNRRTKAHLKVYAADSDTVGGKKSGFVFVDELWLFGKRAGADGMLREAIGGLVARPEGFIIWSSTQSDEPPSGVFKTKLDYFRDVRDGKIKDNKSLPILYEFPKSILEEKGYLEPKNFYMTNPNLGKSVSQEWLEEEMAKELRGDSPNKFLAKHLNVEIGMNLRNDRWPGADLWLNDKVVDRTLNLKELIRRCEVLTIGIDGGGLDDLLGLAVMGREKVSRKWFLWVRAWCHPIVFDRRKEIEVELREFIKQGDLVLCEDPVQDIREVGDICVEVRSSGLLPKVNGIGMDRLGLPGLIDELIAREFDIVENGGTITAVQQGGYLNPAIMGMERKLNDGTLIHAGQKMLAWCVGNAKIELKGSARAVTKQVSGKTKIDPLVAAFDAGMLMSRNPQAERKKEYQLVIV